MNAVENDPAAETNGASGKQANDEEHVQVNDERESANDQLSAPWLMRNMATNDCASTAMGLDCSVCADDGVACCCVCDAESQSFVALSACNGCCRATVLYSHLYIFSFAFP